MSEVPSSLEELKAGFGVAILTRGLEPFFGVGNVPADLIDGWTARYAEAAELIRAADPEVFATYGNIAARVIGYLPHNPDGVIGSLMSDMQNDLYGIRGLLQRDAQPYFTAIFEQAPLERDLEKMKACFEAVAAFGRGE